MLLTLPFFLALYVYNSMLSPTVCHSTYMLLHVLHIAIS
jgi:hypothetical protein